MLVTTACNRKIRMRLTEVSYERDFQVLSHNNDNYNRRLLKSCHMTDIIIYRIACLLGWTPSIKRILLSFSFLFYGRIFLGQVY